MIRVIGSHHTNRSVKSLPNLANSVKTRTTTPMAYAERVNLNVFLLIAEKPAMRLSQNCRSMAGVNRSGTCLPFTFPD
jgi:hypothetical protein